MIRVRLEGHGLHYPVTDLLRLFYPPVPGEPAPVVDPSGGESMGMTVLSTGPDLVLVSRVERLEAASGTFRVTAACGAIAHAESVETAGALQTLSAVPDAPNGPGRPEGAGPLPEGADPLPAEVRRAVKRTLYRTLRDLTGRSYPWGSLTGIRPSLVAAWPGMTPGRLVEEYGVREDKARLAFLVLERERALLASLPADTVAIYVHVPFCRTRCAYCSFVDPTDALRTNRHDAYVDALLREVRAAGTLLRESGLSAFALYVGGGTPTVLSDRNLARLLEGLRTDLPLSSGCETTLEAGRPDTLAESNLQLAAEAGFRRICVNPQSMDPGTLVRIGRRHGPDDIQRTVAQVRAHGFPILNMDLIAGLPGESAATFLDSLDQVRALSPENLTIHTLSRKRGAHLSTLPPADPPGGDPVGDMLSGAWTRLFADGFRPYYLYRQKDMAGGHENTGYALPGTECLYNAAMMGDACTVIGLGAGAMSKFHWPSSRRMERVPNPRNLDLYLAEPCRRMDRKRRFLSECLPDGSPMTPAAPPRDQPDGMVV